MKFEDEAQTSKLGKVEKKNGNQNENKNENQNSLKIRSSPERNLEAQNSTTRRPRTRTSREEKVRLGIKEEKKWTNQVVDEESSRYDVK